MPTVLAQVSAQPVVLGAGSIGPFPIPAGSAGISLVIDRAGLPPNNPLLAVTCMASYDGGQTFTSLGGATMSGGDIPARGGGGTLAQSSLAFMWDTVPTHVRVDVDAQAAFSASFEVVAL